MSADKNLLLIMSDEHSRKWLGAYGTKIAITPNLDKLAARATLFSNAYCASPICVPARAAFATGQHLHQIGYWDNADAYDGRIGSWHHALRDAGHTVTSIGKLHFKSPIFDYGFTEQILPMYVPQGLGDLMGLLRDEVIERSGASKMASMAGPGETDYTRYDHAITQAAIAWLTQRRAQRGKPWALFLSFVAPHFPLTAPQAFYDLYQPEALPLPKLYARAQRPTHPHLRFYASNLNYDRYFETDADVRRAIAGYLGLCSYLDHNIGRVLVALEQQQLLDDTTVVYTSDHGDNLGARGVWGKSTMYEEAVGVPLLIAQPRQSGRRCDTPVSHVDLHPFILQHFGVRQEFGDTGVSRPAGIAPTSDQALNALEHRGVIAQYHATGSASGIFMLRWRQWKLIHHVDQAPELFDLQHDPEELHDLAGEPQHQALLHALHDKLRESCEPLEVDRRARQRQRELVQQVGGRDAILARGDIGYSPAPVEAQP